MDTKHTNYRNIHGTIFTIIILTHACLQGHTSGVITAYHIRSQSMNNARKVAGTLPGDKYEHRNPNPIEGSYHNLSIKPEYTKTFRPSAIAQVLFGTCLQPALSPDGCTRYCDELSMLIQGTAVPNRASNALRADDFYLPDTFQSIVSVNPHITNTIIDCNWYWGLDAVTPGLYLRIYAPFVHTKWNLDWRERTQGGTNGTMVAGSYAGIQLQNALLLQSATSYFAGVEPTPTTFQANPTTTTELIREPLQCTRIVGQDCSGLPFCVNKVSHGRTKNGVAEIRYEIGYDMITGEQYHCGLSLQGAIPTGNTPESTYLFSPIVGNGHHAELGGGISAHWLCYDSPCKEQMFGIFLDATITHLFAHTQTRVFDLQYKPLSRYMVAALHTPINTDIIGGQENPETPFVNPQPSSYQVTGHYSPIANLTQQKVRVWFPVQADIAAWCSYRAGKLSWDIGYNFYGQSSERIKPTSSCSPRLATEQYWAIKGDSHAYGFMPNDSTQFANAPYGLAVSESNATINSPANNNNGNTSVDNPLYAFTGIIMLVTTPNTAANPDATIQLSVPPTFLSTKDIDYEQRSRITTHKLFTHVSYGFTRTHCNPYIGFGAEVEFGITAQKQHGCVSYNMQTPNCGYSCIGSQSIGTSQWGAWVALGVMFE